MGNGTVVNELEANRRYLINRSFDIENGIDLFSKHGNGEFGFSIDSFVVSLVILGCWDNFGIASGFRGNVTIGSNCKNLRRHNRPNGPNPGPTRPIVADCALGCGQCVECSVAIN